jgi:phosphoribosyl-AMP cyclohydrolase
VPWPEIVKGQKLSKEIPSPPAPTASGFFSARKAGSFPQQLKPKLRETTVNDMPVIDFEKMDGLVPGVVQDATTGEVLMLGFLNAVSYEKTLETGFVTFWSRTRQKLWMKGESSGNRLRIVSAATDCDNDSLVFRVVVEGDGLVCHEGTVSCFTKAIAVQTAGELEAVQSGK